ncbi:MAG: serine/threonine protein phosphatase [Alphaproteobacteria bacterium]|nr:serine/threonine protein phosphatase [Alphaproteobacteria bacterium]
MTAEYKIPEGHRIYAIGDVHGYADILARMHDLIEADYQERPVNRAQIVYLGDYVDRGPDSKGVLDQLVERELHAPDFEHIFLLGNHENGMMEFMAEPEGIRQDWLEWGGIEALQSYGVEPDMGKPFTGQLRTLAAQLGEAMPLTHHEFLKNLKLFYEVGDYFFVHAGIRPGVSLHKQTKQDLTFIREPFLSHDKPHEKRVIHGHTAMKEVEVKHNRINLDSGLYRGGPLSCAVIEGAQEVRLLQVKPD